MPPPWTSAPDGWIGGVVPAELAIGRSEEAAVVLSRIVAYPIGFELTLDAHTRKEQAGYAFDDMAGWHGGGEERPAPELLRCGVQFADGRKTSNVGGMIEGTVVAMSATDDPELDPAKDISLMPGGGHGSGRHSRQEYWVWPLPPPGPVAFVCEWPEYGIPESRVEVNAAVILEAADRAEEIWPTPA